MSVVGFGRIIGASHGSPLDPTWFGDGSDGVGVINGLVQIPVEEDVGHILLKYKSLRINESGILTPAARCAGMTILVQGDCVINGTIDLDKMAPRYSEDTELAIQTTGEDANIIQLTAGEVGGDGGNGNKGYATGVGGLGGNGFWCGGGYGGGGGSWFKKVVTGDWEMQNETVSQQRNGYDSEPRPPFWVEWPPHGGYGAGGKYSRFTQEGAGPGGGGSYHNLTTTYRFANGENSASGYYQSDSGSEYTVPGVDGDAYGGGALWLVVGGTLTINGSITARGGNGGGGYSGGGGGGGGLIMLVSHKGLYNNGSILLTGGTGGAARDYNLPRPTRNGYAGSDGTLLTGGIDKDGTVTWD